MSAPAPHPAGHVPRYFFSCLAGPDFGKRLALVERELLVGRSADCNLLSDDPDVTERFAILKLEGNTLRVRGLAPLLPFVDGHPSQEALVVPGQQVRFGRSTWQVSAAPSGEGVLRFVSRIGDHLTSAAGLERPSDWRPVEMFSEVIKRHPDEKVEEYFTVGTARTTPALAAIDTRWPRPWVFVRVLAMSLLLYLGFVWAWDQFENVKLVPALIVMGSVAIPFALLIFFFEVNVPRNISLYQVIKLLLLGGLLSIVVSLFGFRVTGLTSWLGAAGAGIIEETGKALALLLVVGRPRYRWILNGLLLGAAVGAGFAVFESAGYALERGLGEGVQAMRETILTRGVLAVLGGHVLWTALVGAALWRVRGEQPFRPELFVDPKFLRVFGLCVGMHMIWNSPLQLPLYAKYLALGAVAWLLILEFIQAGLKQLRDAQQAAVAPVATTAA